MRATIQPNIPQIINSTLRNTLHILVNGGNATTHTCTDISYNNLHMSMDSRKPLRLCICSDTHGKHESLPVLPKTIHSLKIDLFLHCGDFTNWGSPEHLHSFNAWLGELPLPKERKVVICGNHDSAMLFEMKHQFKVNFDLHLNHATLLSEASRLVSIGGLSITGIPYTNPRTASPKYWLDLMSAETDVLLTHNAIPRSSLCKENMGCESLRQAVEEFYEKHRKPRNGDLLHCFGHVHDRHGTETLLSDDKKLSKLLCVNAGNVGNDREIKFPPILIDCLPSSTSSEEKLWTFKVVEFPGNQE